MHLNFLSKNIQNDKLNIYKNHKKSNFKVKF